MKLIISKLEKLIFIIAFTDQLVNIRSLWEKTLGTPKNINTDISRQSVVPAENN